jgi:hypothetical protein
VKAFNQFLAAINDGSTHGALTADLHELFTQVQQTGKSGSLTLKIKVASASKGNYSVDKVTITADRKLELPKPDQPQDFFWLTEDAEPTRQHPRQHELELRTVGDERGGPPRYPRYPQHPQPTTPPIRQPRCICTQATQANRTKCKRL